MCLQDGEDLSPQLLPTDGAAGSDGRESRTRGTSRRDREDAAAEAGATCAFLHGCISHKGRVYQARSPRLNIYDP